MDAKPCFLIVISYFFRSIPRYRRGLRREHGERSIKKRGFAERHNL
jgi:hypothetical protein